MKATRAFSLIELLVAMAVFAVLATVAFSVLNRVADTAGSNESRVLVAADLRNAMDRMGADWNSAILAASHAPIFEKAEGNDRFRFFTHARAPGGPAPVPGDDASIPRFSETQYAVRAPDNPPSDRAAPEALHRHIQAVAWDETIGAPQAIEIGEPLGEGIFRLELVFLSDDGILSAEPPAAPASIRAVAIAVAALPLNSLRRLDQATADELAGALADCGADQMPLENWSIADFDAFPPFVGEAVTFHQRFFFLQ